MKLNKRDERVFQLSLTEVVMIILFILLLLLGFQIKLHQVALGALYDEITMLRTKKIEHDEVAPLALLLEQIMKDTGTSDRHELLTRLKQIREATDERDNLKQLVVKLKEELTTLTQLKNDIEKLSRTRGIVDATTIVSNAIEFQRKVIEAFETDTKNSPKSTQNLLLEKIINNERIVQKIREELSNETGNPITDEALTSTIVSILKSHGSKTDTAKLVATVEALKKTNADIKGQLENVRKKLQQAKGGNERPPCWADSEGRTEYLFAITLKEEGILIAPAWPAYRESDARLLPGVGNILSRAGVLSNEEFSRLAQPIHSNAVSKDCVHFVRMKSEMTNAIRADRARQVIEKNFYRWEEAR